MTFILIGLAIYFFVTRGKKHHEPVYIYAYWCVLHQGYFFISNGNLGEYCPVCKPLFDEVESAMTL